MGYRVLKYETRQSFSSHETYLVSELTVGGNAVKAEQILGLLKEATNIVELNILGYGWVVVNPKGEYLEGSVSCNKGAAERWMYKGPWEGYSAIKVALIQIEDTK